MIDMMNNKKMLHIFLCLSYWSIFYSSLSGCFDEALFKTLLEKFHTFDPTQDKSNLSIPEIENCSDILKALFIRHQWKYLHTFCHPKEPSIILTIKRQNSDYCLPRIRQLLYIKQELPLYQRTLNMHSDIPPQSHIYLYDEKNNLIGTTNTQKNHISPIKINPFLCYHHIPWGTKGVMTFNNCSIENIESLKATAMYDNAFIMAISNDNTNTTLCSLSQPFYRATSNNNNHSHNNFLQQEIISDSSHEPKSLITIPDLASCLYMANDSVVYIGTSNGRVKCLNLLSNSISIDLRLSQLPITSIVGKKDANIISWIENYNQLIIWKDQKNHYITHKHFKHACILSLDIHPTLPLLVVGTSNQKILIYDYQAQEFYKKQHGHFAGFDYNGSLIVIDKPTEEEIIVKRHQFSDFSKYSIEQLMLFAKIKASKLSSKQLSSYWKEQYKELRRSISRKPAQS